MQHEDLLSAVRSALLRLGQPKDQLGDTLGGLLSHFRSATKDKSLLVIVDHAEEADEGLHFVPACDTAGLLILARGVSSDNSVVHHELSALSPDSAAAILTADLLGGDNERALALIATYGSSPGTMQRLAGLIRARVRSGELTASDVAQSLIDNVTPDLLDATYRTLSPSASWLYRLLSMLPGREFEQSILTVFELPEQQNFSAFNELLDAKLVTEPRPDWYLIEPAISHDSARRAEQEPLPLELLAAMRMTLRWYLKRAQLADRTVMGDRLRRAVLSTDVDSPGFSSKPQALQWFHDHHAALYTSIQMAAFHGWNDEAWGLAEAMWAFFTNVPYPEEAERCYLTAVEATKLPIERARMLLFQGRVQLDLGKFTEAESALGEAHDIATAEGDLELVGTAIELLGRSQHWQGQFADACDYYQASLDNAVTGQRPRNAAIQLLYLGRAKRDSGDLKAAESYFHRALDEFIRIKDGRHVLLAMTDVAVLEVALDMPGAIESADRMIDLLHETGLARHEGAAHERLAKVLKGRDRQRRLELALQAYERVSSVEARRIRRQLR